MSKVEQRIQGQLFPKEFCQLLWEYLLFEPRNNLLPRLKSDQVMHIATFRRGAKRLALLQDNQGFRSHIKNIEGREKKDGETTACYAALHVFLKKIAKRKGVDLNYRFSSTFPNLIEWAQSTGNSIFKYAPENAVLSLITDELKPGYEERQFEFTVTVQPD